MKVLMKKGNEEDIYNFIKIKIESNKDQRCIYDMIEECKKLGNHSYIKIKRLVKKTSIAR